MDDRERTATIITPTFNKADCIQDAARTVFQQTYPYWRWWIVLDGPTPETEAAVRQISAQDSRVEVFHEPTTEAQRRDAYRPAQILNKYIPRVATGRICWLADDDLWEHDFLAQLCGALDEHPDWDIVFAGFATFLILSDGQVVHRYSFADYRDRGLGTGLVCWGEVLSINILFTKRAWDTIQPYEIPESWDTARMCDHLWMREMEAKFTVHGMPKVLVTNRVTAKSANTVSDELNAAEAQGAGISLKRIEEGDLEFVRQLRNANRQAFFDDREVSPDGQRQWFQRLQDDSRVAFHVVVMGDRRVGTVSLTDRGESFEIGNLMLAPEHRGRGVMNYACRMLMKPRYRYTAEVKPQNHASRRLLERLGVEFVIVESAGNAAPAVATASTPARLSIGSGPQRRAGWTTLDAKGDASPDIVATVPPLPASVAERSWDEIEMIHFLQHVPMWQAEELLREIHGVLRPGGLLVLEQPNIHYAARVLLGVEKPPTGAPGQFDLWPFYGDPTHRDPRMLHHWGYHPGSLRELLVKAGFRQENIRDAPAQFHLPVRDFRTEATK